MAADFGGLNLCSTDLPSRTSIERMAIELDVISDIHSAEFLYSTHGLTLSFDSTMQEGIHINVISIHKGHDEYVLALDELALRNTTAITYLKHLYSEWYGLVKSCLVKLECKDERSLPSSGCLIDQIINHFNSLRFTDSLGDPRRFRIHLVKNGLPKVLLKNARGN